MKKLKLIIALLFVAIMAVIILSSCSSTNKHKTVSVTKTDSVSVKKVDSTATKKSSAVSVRKREAVKKVQANVTNEKTITTVYDTIYKEGKQQIKYIIVKEKGTDKTNTIEASNSFDSTAFMAELQTKLYTADSLRKVAEAKATELTKKGGGGFWYWVWVVFKYIWWLLLIAIAYLVYRYWPVIKAVWARFTI